MLSNRNHHAATVLYPLSNWSQSLLPHFLHQNCWVPRGALWLLHNDLPTTTSQESLPILMIATTRTLGPLSVIIHLFLVRGGNSSPQMCLGFVQRALQKSPMNLESMSQWPMQRRLSILGLVSLFISNTGAVEQETMLMANHGCQRCWQPFL